MAYSVVINVCDKVSEHNVVINFINGIHHSRFNVFSHRLLIVVHTTSYKLWLNWTMFRRFKFRMHNKLV